MVNRKEFVDEFFKKHGEHVKQPGTDIFIFEDGASIEMSQTGLGASVDPPSTRYERASRIEMFHRFRLMIAVNDFDTYQRSLVNSAKEAERMKNPAILPDKRKSVDELKRLKGLVARRQKHLKAAQMALADATPAWVTARENEAAETYEQTSSFLADVTAIQI